MTFAFVAHRAEERGDTTRASSLDVRDHLVERERRLAKIDAFGDRFHDSRVFPTLRTSPLRPPPFSKSGARRSSSCGRCCFEHARKWLSAAVAGCDEGFQILDSGPIDGLSRRVDFVTIPDSKAIVTSTRVSATT